jgi:hypothetical protein
MKRTFRFLRLFGLFLFSTVLSAQNIQFKQHSIPFACTSFAVYGKNPVYGMNFDFSDVELRFSIRSVEDRKIFLLDAQMESNFVSICGMNNDGLFANLQMLFPEVELKSSPGENELFTWQVFGESLYQFVTGEEVEKYIENNKIIQGGMTLHSLFADKNGNAFVLEAGDNNNQITKMSGCFIVMTNFPICDFRGMDFKKVEGSGAGRYKTAFRHILDNIEEFDFSDAMKTLELTKLKTKNFLTQCSMVFDPENAEVFLTLDGDFDRIWKVSINIGMIETYSGFDVNRKIELNAAGVIGSDIHY